MTKPLLLDLFGCIGGAARGYQRAGFYVISVDIEPQPDSCADEFVRADAAVFMDEIWAGGFQLLGERPDLIHWSPPCQSKSALTVGTNASRGWGREHVDMIPIMRPLIEATGIPNVLEQPVGRAEMRKDLMLCGDMFRGDQPPPWTQRHRYFEINGFTVPQPKHGKHAGRVRGWRHGVYSDGPYVAVYGSGGGKASPAEARYALGIDWSNDMSRLVEVIPPAYTEYIGHHFLSSRVD